MKISLPRKPDFLGVAEITEKLRRETKIEHLYFVKDNQAFVWFKGYKEYVIPPEEQILRMKDSLVLHNHVYGSSFSFEDIEAIVKYYAKELRIICQNRTFIISRPKVGWGFSFEDQNHYKQYQEAFNEANKYMNRLIESRAMFESERNDFINHFTWKIFFTKFEVDYKHYGL